MLNFYFSSAIAGSISLVCSYDYSLKRRK